MKLQLTPGLFYLCAKVRASRYRTIRSVKATAFVPFTRVVRFSLFIFSVAIIAGASYSGSPGSSVANPTKRGLNLGEVSAALKRPPLRSSLFSPQSSSPGITTFAAGCVVPQSAFVLGDIVCASVMGGTGRGLTFVDPSGFIRQVTSITSDPQNISYQLPATNTSTVNDQTVDNRGTWRVNMITSRGSVVAQTEFVVTNPAAPSANLSISKLVRAGDANIAAGSSGAFEIFVTNFGPDAAANVVLSDTLPTHTTFVNFAQTDGPTFACSLPSVGGTGTVSCTLASFARGASASFTLAYTVDAGTAAGTQICNTATISSDTSDPDTSDNSSQACITVPFSGSGGACTVSCPANITTTADTTDQNGTQGAVVTYPAPTSSGPCGSITTDHCNNCFFPIGTTVVTATADTGDSCSFTVTVNNANVPTITCPANQTANADNNCQANVNVGTATTTGGTNVTVTATRSDGQPMYTCDQFGNCTRNSSDAPFSAGVTTITWTAHSHDIPGPYTAQTGDEESHRTGSASCTQTVTVNDVTPPTIGATDQTISADANCQGTVPDYSSTVTDNCACASSDTSPSCAGHSRIAVTQAPSAGTMLPPGQYPVVIVANDGSSNNDGAGNTSTKTITLTVADQTAPNITCPANITRSNDPGQCSAIVNPGTATATDNCDTNPTITGTRSDNQSLTAPYPVGTTTITWTATDSAGNHSSCNQTITVNDTEPPQISCPANVGPLEPTCPSGAIATYATPVGTDNCPGAVTTRTAGGASGSVFAIGTTTVTYSVTDAHGNGPVSCSFTVTVLTPQQVIQNLINSVNASSLSGAQKQGLVGMLQDALDRINSGDYSHACDKLDNFVSKVQNYIQNGQLSSAQGQPWINSANNVRNTIGCTHNPCT